MRYRLHFTRIVATARRTWLGPALSIVLAIAYASPAESGEELDPQQVRPGIRPTLMMMNADGTGLRKLTGETEFDGQGSPQWSADGRQIIFDGWRESLGDSFVAAHVLSVRPDGTQLQDLGVGALPSFSPGGDLIAFSQYRPSSGVWIMSPTGTDRTLIAEGGWSGTWSPDGRYIAYTSGPDLVLYDVTTTDVRHILAAEHKQGYSNIFWRFQWSRDGKQICYLATKNGNPELAIVDVRGSEHGFRVVIQQECGCQISWHPFAQQLLCSLPDPKSNMEQLFIIDLRGDGPATRVAGQPARTKNTGPDWSPDGKQIVFVSYLQP